MFEARGTWAVGLRWTGRVVVAIALVSSLGPGGEGGGSGPRPGPESPGAPEALAMTPAVSSNVDPLIESGNIVIDEAGYSAKLNGVQLDLTYTEFELLKYLAQQNRWRRAQD